ncbi:MAG: hypothetical protein HUJ99_07810, partial [Bacteroidaceae bacterium]|nr:hypothetical protein [Bacteroidaceae bacterium]
LTAGKWKIGAITRGHKEFRTNNPVPVGRPVLFDGTDATERLAKGLATAIMGYVREIWKPSQAVVAAVKAGKLRSEELEDNMVVEINPQFFPGTNAVTTAYYLDPSHLDDEDAGTGDSARKKAEKRCEESRRAKEHAKMAEKMAEKMAKKEAKKHE